MRRNVRIFSTLFLSACLVAGFTSSAPAQDRVSAKIGIQIHSSAGVKWAKPRDTVKTSDQIRIYVVPKEKSFVYVVHTDKKTATPLLNDTLAQKDEPIVLPFDDGFYQFDGTRKTEMITIICSPTKLSEISTLLNSANVPHARWKHEEKELIEESKISMGSKSNKPYALAGNTRGLLSIQELANQTDAEDDEVSLQIMVHVRGDVSSLTFSATDLPPALDIDAKTGLITGTIAGGAAAASPYKVTVSASGTVSASSETHTSNRVFEWKVTRPKELPKGLRMSSGKSLLVKTYEFRVKK